MKLLTSKDNIRTVSNRWDEQYKITSGKCKDNSKYLISQHLKELDVETATVEDVTKIIGNASWTDIRCDECNENIDKAIQLGEEPDYESPTVVICKKCFEQAIKLFSISEEKYVRSTIGVRRLRPE